MQVADKNYEMLKVLTPNGEFTGEYKDRGYIHKNGCYHQEVAFIPVTMINGGGVRAFTEAQQK